MLIDYCCSMMFLCLLTTPPAAARAAFVTSMAMVQFLHLSALSLQSYLSSKPDACRVCRAQGLSLLGGLGPWRIG